MKVESFHKFVVTVPTGRIGNGGVREAIKALTQEAGGVTVVKGEREWFDVDRGVMVSEPVSVYTWYSESVLQVVGLIGALFAAGERAEVIETDGVGQIIPRAGLMRTWTFEVEIDAETENQAWTRLDEEICSTVREPSPTDLFWLQSSTPQDGVTLHLTDSELDTLNLMLTGYQLFQDRLDAAIADREGEE